MSNLVTAVVDSLSQRLQKTTVTKAGHVSTKEFAFVRHSTQPADTISMPSRYSVQREQITPQQLARNTSPINCLPNEILSRIFHITIYSNDAKDIGQPFCKAQTIAICQSPSVLPGVCSRWREVALSNRSLWSFVPVMEHPPGHLTFNIAQLSLQRAGDHGLRLVAFWDQGRPEIRDFVVKTWAQHGPRFNAIDLHGNYDVILSKFLPVLREDVADAQNSVKELSICYFTSYDGRITRKSRPRATAYSPALRKLSWSKNLLESLQVLRSCGNYIYFKDLSLRMLTELRLQNMVLHSIFALPELLESLSSSTQLRKLEIISVLIGGLGWKLNREIQPPRSFPISLPCLQHLYLEDLTISMLHFIPKSITPGSGTVTLNWTDRCWESVSEDYEVDSLSSLDLENVQIDVLMLRQERNVSFNGDIISSLLQAMPTVTTLHLDSVYLDSGVFQGLVSPGQSNNKSGIERTEEISQNQNDYTGSFARLTSLYISRSHCHDLDALHDLFNVAVYHSLAELGVGIGPECNCDQNPQDPGVGGPNSHTTYNQAEIDSTLEKIWDSLAGSVPRLVRLSGDPSSIPPALGFESRIWQL